MPPHWWHCSAPVGGPWEQHSPLACLCLLTSAILHAFYFWFLSQVYATGSFGMYFGAWYRCGRHGPATSLLREAISLNGWLACLIMPEFRHSTGTTCRGDVQALRFALMQGVCTRGVFDL